MSGSPEVSLADVDEALLEQLLQVALADAAPDDVTPPLGGAGWTPERIAWFRAYHRAAAAGLSGPAAEKTWAVFCDGIPAGSVRLKLTGTSRAETGIWLAGRCRGRGVGTAALGLVLAEARRAGLEQVVAHTTAGNAAAQRLLAVVGAALTCDDGVVSAAVELPN